MMKKLVALVLLASLTLMTGCFTAIGAVASTKTNPNTGNAEPNSVARGALIGALVDAALIAVVLSNIGDAFGGYGEPDQDYRVR